MSRRCWGLLFSPSTHLAFGLAGTAMAFTFAAFCYMLTLVLCAALIFFVIWQVSLTETQLQRRRTFLDQSGV